ncbi:hypothetical protein AGABI2DRAFT_190088 [Agaricus bisporus var. bisporus H97]|uniref:hypothetical protein n=1 Tax=Agaricus bisporus var. bisporus (strain H97 / ATCC MYA-4626 / FGSC 10389) TaxID=936046 RepID=UPI00029F7606|nr:hypothetical protein AGABI2DRAFT_190088 [Agaricus bisporus var. bisporus H97]EKV51879.1 hypothetical protein AGABI2DRAFT_190088 [Agaricus bisporus var. bisporus H97]
MSGIGSWLWGTSQIDDAVEKATSELLPAGSEDIALNLEICDQIRSKSAPAKDAMQALKRRLNHKNPNVQLLALGLTDTCVKNGGDHFLAEIASREFMDNLVSILKVPALNHQVKNTILRLVQNWSTAFEGRYALGYVGQVYKSLQGEGFKFPPKDIAVANSAMVDTQTAPEWIDSEVCLRCRTAFTFTNRKHHCRNCGQVFDQQCSSKSLPLPHFGITQEVRVCDGCYNKLTRKADKLDKRHRSTHSTPNPSRHRNGQELADAELQRAIELSLQETNKSPGYAPTYSTPSSWQPQEPPLVDNKYSNQRAPADEEDPELKAAIEASLREANAPRPSAPAELPRPEQTQYSFQPEHARQESYTPTPTQPPLPKVPAYDLDALETDAIMTFNQTVGQAEANGGRDLSRYPALTELYEKASHVRPKLALSVDDAGRKEQILSEMHEKLSQAVKLYDQILTEQVMNPRWRASRSPQQQYQPSPQNQWAPSQTPAPQAPGPSYQTSSAQYAPQPPTVQEYRSPTSTQPQWTYSGQNQSAQQLVSPQAAPTPTPIPQFVASPPPIQQPASPVIQVPHFVSPPVTAAPINMTAPPQQPSRSPQIAFTQAPPSFSPSQQYQTQPNQGAALGRSNTIAHPGQYQPTPSPQHNVNLHRQQSLTTNQPPSNLPQFPMVPSGAPVFDSSMHNGVVQSEQRKEAMLIDL